MAPKKSSFATARPGMTLWKNFLPEPVTPNDDQNPVTPLALSLVLPEDPRDEGGRLCLRRAKFW